MATANPFDLLVDDDYDELLRKIVSAQVIVSAKAQTAAQPAKLPSKPLPPAQAGHYEVSKGSKHTGGSLLTKTVRSSPRIAYNTSFSKFTNTNDNPVDLDESSNDANICEVTEDSDDGFVNPPEKKARKDAPDESPPKKARITLKYNLQMKTPIQIDSYSNKKWSKGKILQSINQQKNAKKGSQKELPIETLIRVDTESPIKLNTGKKTQGVNKSAGKSKETLPRSTLNYVVTEDSDDGFVNPPEKKARKDAPDESPPKKARTTLKDNLQMKTPIQIDSYSNKKWSKGKILQSINQQKNAKKGSQKELPIETLIRVDTESPIKLNTGKKTQGVNKSTGKSKETLPRSTLNYVCYSGDKLKLKTPPHNLMAVVRKFDDKQKETVKDIGFGTILRWKIDEVPTGLGYWLLKNYDASTCVLNLGSHEVHITPKLVHTLFGIPQGENDIEECLRLRKIGETVATWRGQFRKEESRITPKMFFDYLLSTKTYGKIFKLNFLVLFNTVMGETTFSNTVNQFFLKSVSEGIDIRSLNWCKYMISCLNKHVRAWDGESSFHGPATLLAVALAHDQKIKQFVSKHCIEEIDGDDLENLCLELDKVRFEELLSNEQGLFPKQRYPFQKDDGKKEIYTTGCKGDAKEPKSKTIGVNDMTSKARQFDHVTSELKKDAALGDKLVGEEGYNEGLQYNDEEDEDTVKYYRDTGEYFEAGNNTQMIPMLTQYSDTQPDDYSEEVYANMLDIFFTQHEEVILRVNNTLSEAMLKYPDSKLLESKKSQWEELFIKHAKNTSGFDDGGSGKYTTPQNVRKTTQGSSGEPSSWDFTESMLGQIANIVTVKEARKEGVRGGRGGGRGYGRGRGSSSRINRDLGSNEDPFGNRGLSGDQGVIEESNGGKGYERRGVGGYSGPRGGLRGGRCGGFANGDVEDGGRPRRQYERHSGTRYGNEFKREGADRGNWGSQADEITRETEEIMNEEEKNQKTAVSDKPLNEEESNDEKKENAINESEEKEPEDKEMTLEEYQKVLEEKRKALEALKTEERKVEVDKELASMQQLSNKKNSDDIFVKLRTDKDKRKEIAEKEERAKKSLSINEFLKPAGGGRNYTRGGRGRGGQRGGGLYNQGSSSYDPESPKIEDPSHFPTLGGK